MFLTLKKDKIMSYVITVFTISILFLSVSFIDKGKTLETYNRYTVSEKTEKYYEKLKNGKILLIYSEKDGKKLDVNEIINKIKANDYEMIKIPNKK